MHIVDEPRKFSPSNVLTYTVAPLEIRNFIFEIKLKIFKIKFHRKLPAIQ